MIDQSKLDSGRATDKLVAEAIGWTDVGPPPVLGPVDLVGVPPGGRPDKPIPVPFYSGSTAALFALEEMQQLRGLGVKLLLLPCEPERPERWLAREDGGSVFTQAETQWLAICRLVVGTMEAIVK